MLSFGSFRGPLFHPSADPGGAPLGNQEPSNAPKPVSRNEQMNAYLKTLASWAEVARQNGNYNDARDAAVEVLTELGFTSKASVLGVAPKEVSDKVPQGLRPALSQALAVMGRESWSVTKRHGVSNSERDQAQLDAYKLLSLCCMLNPVDADHQRTFQNIAADGRKDLRNYQGTSSSANRTQGVDSPIDLITQGALESVEAFLKARFRMTPETFDWVSTRLFPEEVEILQWALEQAASLAQSRAASLVHRDRFRSNGFSEQVLRYGLACFKSLGLPTNSKNFKDIKPHSMATRGALEPHLKRIMRVSRILATAYRALGQMRNMDELERVGNEAGAAADSALQAPRATAPTPTLGPRPSRPQFPPSTPVREAEDTPPPVGSPSVQTVSESNVATAQTPSRPEPRLVMPPPPKESITPSPKAGGGLTITDADDWDSLRKRVQELDALKLSSSIMNACTGQLIKTGGGKAEPALKNQALFPAEKFTAALREFAVDIDILKRGGTAAVHLFIEHHVVLFDLTKADTIELVRLQVACSFIRTHCQVADEDQEGRKTLATNSNKALAELNLRADHKKAQDVFYPIVDAAVRGKLR